LLVNQDSQTGEALSKTAAKKPSSGKAKKEPKNSTAAPSWRRRLLLQEGALIGWLAISAYLLVALFSYSREDSSFSYSGADRNIDNAAGVAGAWLADISFSLCGWLAYLFPLLLVLRAWNVFLNRKEVIGEFDWITFSLRIAGLLLVMTSATALAELHHGGGLSVLPNGVGGILGGAVGGAAAAAFSYTGSTLVLIAVFLFGITVFTDLSWLAVIDKLGAISLRVFEFVRSKIVDYRSQRKEHQLSEEATQARQKTVAKKSRVLKERQEPVIMAPDISKIKATSERIEQEKQVPLFKEHYSGELPPLNLLDRNDGKSDKGYSTESLEAMSRLLELKLQDFGISVEVVEVLPGPVITRFEVQPAPGIKVSRITNLAKDLARSLAVVSVRVVEVIPGKSVIGIEIPNEHREMVHLGDVLASPEFDTAKSPLSLALGHDISGQPVIADLAKMPHLLVAGTTGSGKSVGINAMLLSLLFKATPEDVRLILVDPKMLELAVYDDIPHLLTPVITDMKDAASGLRWCVGEMERRYKLMATLGVRNLAGYNRKVLEASEAGEPLLDPFWQPDALLSVVDDERELPTAPELTKLPNIVVVIDEFADMMMIVGKKVEQLIARIAQKARAAGIHLILATQRPSVDVITGLIKANVPTRMAFQVSSKIDSRTILDQGGAEQLLGHGDMLYLPAGSGVPVRVHGAFVDDHEVHKVVADLKERGAPDYLQEITDEQVTAAIAVPGYSSDESDADDPEADALYDEAVNFVIESRRASISSVQRKLRVGYNRAARLVEAMEAAGVVSEMNTNGSREVLVPNRSA